uniref:Ig-like domain-containing protein n=1 Tax=Podarcis muralis TaxID=64176 RepID=A0A670JHP6_PODMU
PENPIVGFLGKEAILPCQLTTSSIPESTSIQVQWILEKSSEKIDVKSYYGRNRPETQDNRYRGRAELSRTDLSKGNMSLILKKTHLNDQGNYTYRFYDTWSNGKLICGVFSFAAKGTEPTIALVDYKGWGIGLTCSSNGWYPKPKAFWLDSEGKVRSKLFKETSVYVNMAQCEPDSYVEVQQLPSSEAVKWQEAMEKEMASMKSLVGFLGKDVILPCQLTTSSIPESTSMQVQWILDKSSEKIDVKSYYGRNRPETQDNRYRGRAELSRTDLSKGNMSLILKKTHLSDQGNYTCIVFLGDWYDEVVVELVLAGEFILISLIIRVAKLLGLTCSSNGWYPKPKAFWLVSEGKVRSKQSDTTITETKAGNFTVSSSIITDSGVDHEVSCKIINELLEMESESRILISGE